MCKKCITKKGGYKGGRGGLEVLPPKAVNLDGFFLAGLLRCSLFNGQEYTEAG